MITFVQSFVSTKPICDDGGIYSLLQKKFGKMKYVALIGQTERNLTKKEIIKVAFRAIMNSCKKDFLLGWNADTALYTWLVSKILCRKRTILGQNLILNPKQMNLSWKTKLRGILYHIALKDKRFYVTVNSPELIPFYCDIIKARKEKFFTVYDSMTLNDFEKSIASCKSLSNSDLYIVGGVNKTEI